MPDLYSTNTLTGIVRSLQMPPSFLIDTFFRGVQTEQSEEIHFDVEADTMGLAPFVSPVVEGQIMSDQGFVTKTFKPAYVKPKHPITPDTVLKRTIGEPITGNLSPADREAMKVVSLLKKQRDMIDRRLEWMASSVIRTGAVTVVGDKYPTSSVDFGRDAALTFTLAGGSKWSDAGISPLDNLATWNQLVITKSGSAAANVVFTVDTWNVFRKNAEVINRINIQRALTQNPSLSQDALFTSGGQYMGTIDGFNIWVYQGWYKDDSGNVTPFLPAGTVLMVGDIMGYRAFGAILDGDSNYQAVEYFSKSWKEEDPARRFVMTQSAPLIVPYRPNASLCATVL